MEKQRRKFSPWTSDLESLKKTKRTSCFAAMPRTVDVLKADILLHSILFNVVNIRHKKTALCL